MTRTVRSAALRWLKDHMGIAGGVVYSSRYYPAEESWTASPAWWHNIPVGRLADKRVKYVRLLCQTAIESLEFHYLRVPTAVLRAERDNLEVSGGAIRLHLSADRDDRFVDLRGAGRIDFSEYLIAEEGSDQPPSPAIKQRVYHVYVIELAPAAVRGSSPGALPPLYVGQTWHSPEHRFAQHMAGGQLAGRVTRKYGIRLRPDLWEGIGPFSTREQAEAAEAALAEQLEARGHRVFWG